MRHAAAFCNQFPVTAYVTAVILYYPPTTANVKEKRLASNRKILNDYRSIKPLAFNLNVRVFARNLVLLFQVNHYFTTIFLYV